MRGRVVVPQPEPEQRVVLDLSVAELALIANLAHSHLGGSSALRTGLESGLVEAAAQLSPKNGELYRTARVLSKHASGWNSENVEQVFA